MTEGFPSWDNMRNIGGIYKRLSEEKVRMAEKFFLCEVMKATDT